ncbi:MAG: ATP-binding protein [Anaerolineae bacterium]|nr:ATP-binding protein [Anaerolineae bacterium]
MAREAQAPPPPRPERRRVSSGTRIILLALAALVPLILLHIFSVFQIVGAQEEHLRHDLEDRAEIVAMATSGIADSARTAAQALSEVPAVTPEDPEGTRAILRALQADRPEFVNLWAADAAGRVYATALPGAVETLPSIADEAYFRRALTGAAPFVTTDRGIPQLPDAFVPVAVAPVQRDAQVTGTVQIAFRLLRLGELAQHVTLPRDSVVTIVDGQGTVITRNLDPERWVGASVVQTEAWQTFRGMEEGTFEGPGLDGVRRLHGFQMVPGTDWLAVVGVPLPEARGAIRQTLVAQFAFLALLVLSAGLLTWRARQLADTLDAQRRRLQGIIDRLPEGVIITAPDGSVVLANRVLEELLGMRIRAGLSYRSQLEPDITWLDGERQLAWADLPFERARRGEVVHDAYLAVVRPDGSRRDLLVDALPLRGPGGGIAEVLAVVTDITPLKEIDRAKDEFISVAAHELRNPLAGLRGYAQILLRRAREKGYDEETVRILSAVDDQADRLTQLTSRLLDVSRLAMGRFQVARQPADLTALAGQVRESLQLTTPRHRLTLQSRPARITADLDADALRQVLNNLVGNAITYAPGGEVAIRLFQEEEQADVFVSDQGPGIAPDELPHIFERFRRVAARPGLRPGGLGLGLYLSKGIVEAHGGRIGVASQPGVGSTFWFSLPLRAGETSRQPSLQAWQEAELPEWAVRSLPERSSP